MASDDFNRANGAPGANWAQAFPGFSVPPIAANRLTWPQYPSLHWATMLGADQYASVGLQANIGGAILLRLTNPNSGSETCYRVTFSLSSPYSAELQKIVAGTQTSLGYFNWTMDPADLYAKASVVGDLITLYGSPDGVTWTVRRTWTDSSIHGAGYVGLYSPNNGGGPYGSLDDFEANTITTYSLVPWVDGVTPENAENLGHMDEGILDAHARIANIISGRLGQAALEITNWNSAIDNGWYYAAPGTNAPAAFAGSLVIGRVERAEGFVTQTTWQYALSNSLLAPKYERRYDGSWGPWFLLGGGADLSYDGDWVAGTYQDGDVVVKDGIAYICVGGPTAVAPDPVPWGIAPQIATIGTSLPASPVDGQEAILTDSLTTPSYQWRFRYNASITDAYKWIYLGGSPAYSLIPAQEAIANVAYSALTTPGPSIAIPRAGYYDVRTGAQVLSNDVNGAYMSYDIGGTAAIDVNAVITPPRGSGSNYQSIYGLRRLGPLAAAITLTAKYRYGAVTPAATFRERYMEVVPVRVS